MPNPPEDVQDRQVPARRDATVTRAAPRVGAVRLDADALLGGVWTVWYAWWPVRVGQRADRHRPWRWLAPLDRVQRREGVTYYDRDGAA